MTGQRISLPRPAPLDTRIAATVGLIDVLWLLLPVGPPTVSRESSSDTCLSIADRPPAADVPDVLTRLERYSALVPEDLELPAALADRHVSEGQRDVARRSTGAH